MNTVLLICCRRFFHFEFNCLPLLVFVICAADDDVQLPALLADSLLAVVKLQQHQQQQQQQHTSVACWVTIMNSINLHVRILHSTSNHPAQRLLADPHASVVLPAQRSPALQLADPLERCNRFVFETGHFVRSGCAITSGVVGSVQKMHAGEDDA